MSFLAPIFLAGLAAVAAPILWHLIKRRPTETSPFPSLMLLEPSPPRVTKRSRLEDLLLLLIRILMLMLIAAAFARPYFGSLAVPAPRETPNQQILVLVDSSASMQREGLWSAAVQRCDSILRGLLPGDSAEIRIFDETAETVVSLEQWQNTQPADRAGLAMAAIKARKPGWKSTHLARAILSAAETLDTRRPGKEGKPARSRIVVISDFQSGSKLEGLAGQTWSKDLDVKLEPLTTSNENVSIHWFSETDSLASQTNGSSSKIRVQNHPGSKKEQFRIGWARPASSEFANPPLSIQVPPGQSRTITLPPPTAGAATDGVLVEGDGVPFDNRLYRTAEEAGLLRILALTEDEPKSEKSMLFFLQRALLETSRQKLDLVVRRGSEDVTESDLNGTRLVVLMEPASPTAWKAARESLRRGKTVVAAIRSTGAAPRLAELLNVPSLNLLESTSADELWTRIDWDHPLMAIFADPKFSDFTRIRFWKHRRIQLDQIPQSKAVVTFDKGDPALIVAPVDAGQCVILTSSWALDDSQLALSSKFVPLIYRLLEWSGALVETSAYFQVGGIIPLPPATGGEVRRWLSPNGQETSVAPEIKVMTPDQPGIYQLSTAGKTIRFAVNLTPEESKIQPLQPDELERMGVPVRLNQPETGKPSELSSEQRLLKQAAIEVESRQKGWRWLLCGAMVLFLLESGMTAWISRRTVSVS